MIIKAESPNDVLLSRREFLKTSAVGVGAILGGSSTAWLSDWADEARRMPVANRQKFENPKIPVEFADTKIFFISDFHLCLGKSLGLNLRHAEDFQKMIEEVRAEISEKDILVLGGDYVAYPHFEAKRDLPEVEKLLSNFSSFPQTKLALFGNHDWEYGEKNVAQIRKFLERADFDVLADESRILKVGAAELPTFGTKDWRLGGMEISEVQKFAEEFRSQFKLILTHNPDWVQKNSSGFEDSLVLAGHTHGGHFSNSWIRAAALYQAKYKSDLISGRHKVRDSVDLIISNGVGATLPFRQNCPSDYSVVELCRSEN